VRGRGGSRSSQRPRNALGHDARIRPGFAWGLSSVGRATALHAVGQEFEPPSLHQFPAFVAGFKFAGVQSFMEGRWAQIRRKTAGRIQSDFVDYGRPLTTAY
jgi:hypothetical protein